MPYAKAKTPNVVSDVVCSREEVAYITGRVQAAAQERELKRLGIHCWRNAIGEVVVLRGAVRGMGRERPTKEETPDYEAL